jgi:hypothetical protein
MPTFNENDNYYTEVPLKVESIPPTEFNEIIDLDIDTASVFRDIQYDGSVLLSLNGSPNNVTYYSKLLQSDDLVVNADDISDRTIKQYRRINHLEIRVTQADSMTLDDSSNTSAVTGTANFYPVLTPHIGDVFVKDIDSTEGTYGVFQVTNVERKSPYHMSSWGISYSQIRYSKSFKDEESEPFVFDEIDFEISNLELGRNPLVPVVTNLKLQTKQQIRAELIPLYYRTFYNKPIGTFIVPISGGGTVYDPYLVNFWNSTISVNEYSPYAAPIEYQTNNAFHEKEYSTVFDVYMKQQIGLLQNAVKCMDKISTLFFSAQLLKITAFATGLDYILHPPMNIDWDDAPMFKPEVIVPVIPPTDPIVLPTPYIFSNNFYDSGVPDTLLEKLILSVISRKTISTKDVNQALEIVKTGTKLEQFYHIPFILSLLQVSR